MWEFVALIRCYANGFPARLSTKLTSLAAGYVQHTQTRVETEHVKLKEYANNFSILAKLHRIWRSAVAYFS